MSLEEIYALSRAANRFVVVKVFFTNIPMFFYTNKLIKRVFTLLVRISISSFALKCT